MDIPREVGYNGGVEYRFYPGGVQCLISYIDESGVVTESVFVYSGIVLWNLSLW